MPRPGPLTDDDQKLLAGIDQALIDIGESIEAVELRAGLRMAMESATAVNVYLNATEPWKLMKSDRERAATVLWTAIAAIAGLRVGFSPYLPFTSETLAEMLGGQKTSGWRRPEIAAGTRLGEVSPLFRKIEDDILEDGE